MDKKKASGTGYPLELISLLSLVAAVFWFNHEIIWAGKAPFFRDLGLYFYPMRFNLAMSLQSGELPLWNRHVAMGFPLAANIQSGTFYPPHLFFLLLPFFDAIRFLFVFHYLVAAMGSYFLCRQWNYPPYLALAGAILFAFGGMIVSLTNLLDHFQSAVWLPWVLFFGERFIRSRSWRNFLLLTFVLLTQFLAGSPEMYGISLGFLLLDGLRIKAEQSDITYPKLLLSLVAANGLVACLAMVQILPTLELLHHSWRSDPIPYEKGALWSLSPLRLVNFFFLDKEVEPGVFNGLRLFFASHIPFILSLYIGAIALPGIFLWLVLSSAKEKIVLLGLVVFSLVLAMGDHTPVYKFLLNFLTFLRHFRFPEKFLLITTVLVLFIALTGLFRFLQSDTSPRRIHRIAIALPLLLLSLIYLSLRLNDDLLIQFIAWAKHSSQIDGVSSGVLVQLERQILIMAGICLVIFLWKGGKLRSDFFKTLLVMLIFFDLSTAHRPYQFLLDPALVSQGSTLIDPRDKGTYRLFYNSSLSHLHPDYYEFSPRSFAGTVSSIFATLFPNTGVFHGFDYMQELDALGRRAYSLFLDVAVKLPPERLYRLLGIMNIKYINSLQSLPPGDIKLLRHFPEYPFWLYRIGHVVPRTYIASEVVAGGDPMKTLDQLTSAGFDPLKQVILVKQLPMLLKKDFQSEAKIVRYTNHQVIIQASLNGPGVLVLADSFYPGWRVYVDGKEKQILRANVFFRAVPLSPGEHLVEFRYQPLSFTIGLIISLITLCGIIIWSVILYNLKRSRRLQQGHII